MNRGRRPKGRSSFNALFANDNMNFNGTGKIWRYAYRYVLPVILVLCLAISFIRRGSLRGKLEIRELIRSRVAEEMTLTEVVLVRSATSKFRLIDDPQDGIFPNDDDNLIDAIVWYKRKISVSGHKRRWNPRQQKWRGNRLSPEEDSKAYEEGTRKFLLVKDQGLLVGDHVR